MADYSYICSICNHAYHETREADQPQWVTACPVNGCTGTLEAKN